MYPDKLGTNSFFGIFTADFGLFLTKILASMQLTICPVPDTCDTQEGKNTSDAENSKIKYAFSLLQLSNRAGPTERAKDKQHFTLELYRGAKQQLEQPPKRDREVRAGKAPRVDRTLIVYKNKYACCLMCSTPAEALGVDEDAMQCDGCMPQHYPQPTIDLSVDGRPWRSKAAPDKPEYKVPAPPGIADWIYSCVFVIVYDDDTSAALVGAVYYRYLPCACQHCMQAMDAPGRAGSPGYQSCANAFTAARAGSVRGFKQGQILCPFRLKPREVVSRERRAQMKKREETVWPEFFNGVQWCCDAPGPEEDDVEESWSDWIDDTIVAKLRRGHSVAEDLEDGDFFAVYMSAAANQTHEKLGWCVYQMVGEMEVLTEDAAIENRCSRGDHILSAGETVVTGRPLVCNEISDDQSRIYTCETKR
jgi:hypothetical protein